MLQAVAQQVLHLRALLPRVDVSKMLAQHPELIFRLEPRKVSQQLHLLRQALLTSAIVHIMLQLMQCSSSQLHVALQRMSLAPVVLQPLGIVHGLQNLST